MNSEVFNQKEVVEKYAAVGIALIKSDTVAEESMKQRRAGVSEE